MKPKRLNLEISVQEARLIDEIVRRYVNLCAVPGHEVLGVDMDITVCHLNGNPLELKALTKANDLDLVHDVSGIRRHIDRSSGELTGLFSPRYSA